MKKSGLILVLLFLLNICASAQIQRNFFDFTLGVTTKKEVSKYFRKNGKKLYKDKEGINYVNDLRFGGHIWPFAAFSFYNGVLSRVYFADSENSTERETLDIVWDTIKKNISNKYSEYYVPSRSKDDYLIYRDNNTTIQLSYEFSYGSKSLSIMYIDEYIFNKEYKEGSDEL